MFRRKRILNFFLSLTLAKKLPHVIQFSQNIQGFIFELNPCLGKDLSPKLFDLKKFFACKNSKKVIKKILFFTL